MLLSLQLPVQVRVLLLDNMGDPKLDPCVRLPLEKTACPS